MNYPIYTPYIEPYTTSIKKALSDGWISSQGEFIEKALSMCKEKLDTPYAVLVNNGTSATHLLYKSLRFKYPHLRKIYVPNYVFVAVWNCALYEYDSTQIEVLSVNPETMNIDESSLENLDSNSAIVIVHNIGNVIDVPKLKQKRPDLVFIEDCCEAFFEEYPNGKKTGTESLCAAVSFFGNKVITTGEGGLWYTNDKELYEYIYKSCHHGMTSERYIYDVLGYNYRMTNLQAALLYDQMNDIVHILENKRKVRDRYNWLFENTEFKPITNGLWMFVLRTPYSMANSLTYYGIDTRPMFYPIQKHLHLKHLFTHVQSVDVRHDEIIMIPSSPMLSSFDQVFIANAFKQVIKNITLKIVRATKELLTDFCSNSMPSTFRYFSKHSVDECLTTHTLTLIGLVDDVPIAYGHIDDRWLGICVLPDYQSKKYGTALMDFLTDFAKIESIPLRLTVDKENIHAQKLYTRYGFEIVSSTETYHYMTNDSSSCIHR